MGVPSIVIAERSPGVEPVFARGLSKSAHAAVNDLGIVQDL